MDYRCSHFAVDTMTGDCIFCAAPKFVVERDREVAFLKDQYDYQQQAIIKAVEISWEKNR